MTNLCETEDVTVLPFSVRKGFSVMKGSSHDHKGITGHLVDPCNCQRRGTALNCILNNYWLHFLSLCCSIAVLLPKEKMPTKSGFGHPSRHVPSCDGQASLQSEVLSGLLCRK